MNQGQKIRYYDYGHPFYKVYDPNKQTSVYFAVKKYGGKRKAKAAAKEYLAEMDTSKLDALLRASQDKSGLPRGMSVFGTVYDRKVRGQAQEYHVVQLRVEAGMAEKPLIQRSVGLRLFSEVFEELAIQYAKRLKLDDDEREELLALEDTARKTLLKKYRKACRDYGTKPRADYVKNIKS